MDLMSELAQRWRRSVVTLADVLLRVAYARNEVLTGAPGEVAAALEEICAASARGQRLDREVMATMVAVLAAGQLGARVDELRLAAQSHGLPLLTRLLRRSPTAEIDVHPNPPVATQNGRALSLGERKSLARKPSRRALDILMLDPNPTVIAQLLANPRMTEDDVIRIAARRPGRPEVLAAVARHPKWLLRSRVRRALIRNPATPPEVALPLVRLLLRPELTEMAQEPDVPPAVRQAAAELLKG